MALEHYFTCECCGISAPDVKQLPHVGKRCKACTPKKKKDSQ